MGKGPKCGLLTLRPESCTGFVDGNRPLLSTTLGWWWANDITRLTWAYCNLAGTTSHDIRLNFPQCCVRNQLRIPLVTATDDISALTPAISVLRRFGAPLSGTR
jgi:hypothetical protein